MAPRGLNEIAAAASVAAVMRTYRVATIAVLLLALTAAGALALRHPVRSPARAHGFAASQPVDLDSDVDGAVAESAALRPALDGAPRLELTAQSCWLRALRFPARDPIPLRRCKVPPSDDDPFARG